MVLQDGPGGRSGELVSTPGLITSQLVKVDKSLHFSGPRFLHLSKESLGY